MTHIRSRAATIALTACCLLLGCGPFRGGPPGDLASARRSVGDLGHVLHGGRDGVWIDLGRELGIERGTLLWAWPAAAGPPPFRTPPGARLEVLTSSASEARARVLPATGSGHGLDGGWVVVEGSTRPVPHGTRLAVPAPHRLPDPTGWPAGELAVDDGAGPLDLDAISRLVYEPLVREHRLALLPGAARSWAPEAGGRRWRFELRPGLTWPGRGAAANDGNVAVSAREVARALAEALASTSPATLAGALLAHPPAVEDGALVLATRVPVPDFPRFLAVPELGLRGPAGGGTGGYRRLAGPQVELQRRSLAAGPARITLVRTDPRLAFLLGETQLWRGIAVEAPALASTAIAATNATPAARGDRRTAPAPLPAGELWVVLIAGPDADLRPAVMDRDLLVRTCFPGGSPTARLGDLVLGEAPAPGAKLGAPAAGQQEPAARSASASIPLRLIVPERAPAALERLAERLQAELMHAGRSATVLRGDPRSAGSGIGVISVLAIGPRSTDPCLRLWDLVESLGWRRPEAVPELRAAVLAAARQPDRAHLEAASERLAATLGVVPVGRVPQGIWLRPEVEGDAVHRRWPRLWTLLPGEGAIP